MIYENETSLGATSNRQKFSFWIFYRIGYDALSCSRNVMIAIRLSNNLFSSKVRSIFANPFSIFVFLYFLVSSGDYLHIPLLFFKIKLTNLVSFLVLLFCFTRKIQLFQRFAVLTLALLGGMCFSAFSSNNIVVCFGFVAFFIFNYFCYFLVSCNLFRFFNSNFVFSIYFASFYCVGFYALCQVLFSTIGIMLPGVNQGIFGIARGQAFTYEPSYYALYMTPFVICQTAKFIFEDSSERKIGKIFWPNLFFLISTSTGCFFSYLFFLLFFVFFRMFGWLEFLKVSIIKTMLWFCLFSGVAFGAFSFINSNLLAAGLLKFFYKGTSHASLQERWEGLVEYWNIFLENPIFGVGFGSGPYYLAQKKLGQADLLDPWILQHFAPMNVTTEVLAGLGGVGAICFCGFFYLLGKMFLAVIKIPQLAKEERLRFLALSLSLCVMFATLQFNQSIMRCYMWIHVGIFCGYAKYLQDRFTVNLLRSNKPLL